MTCRRIQSHGICIYRGRKFWSEMERIILCVSALPRQDEGREAGASGLVVMLNNAIMIRAGVVQVSDFINPGLT